MKKIEKKSGKLNIILYLLIVLLMSFTYGLQAQNDKVKTAEYIEFERQAEEYQKQLTQQCTDKMLQLLRDAPIVVEGVYHENEMERNVGIYRGQKYRYFCLKVIVSQVLKGKPTLQKDTLYFTRLHVPLDQNGKEIYGDHSFSPGLYPDRPIILMLKPNDDINSPFLNDARKNYIAYDPIQPSIGYGWDRANLENTEPLVCFTYSFGQTVWSAMSIKQFNSLTKDIPELKSLQKKKPRKCWFKKRT